jgi:HAD superfamily hydrolase (TIGR01509 family)
MNLYIFDLGNVVIKTDFRACFDTWSRYCSRPAEQLIERFRIDKEFEAFERGEMSPMEYFAHFKRLLGIDMTYNEFVEGWNAVYQGLFDEVVVSLRQLKRYARLVALTNTNEIHCEVWPKLYPTLHDVFETIYISNEMGLRKPEAAIFEHVLARESAEPAQSVFFDDHADNVAAAQALGIRGIVVASPEDILRVTGNTP